MAGASQPSMLGFLGWTEEASFAEVSASYDKVLQIRDASLDFSGLTQEIIPRGGVYNRVNQMDNGILGPHQGATFSFTCDLYGHGAATDGSLTETELARLLGHAVGNSDADMVGGDCTGTGSSTTQIESTNVTAAIGDIGRVGTINDGGGEGQATVFTSASSSFSLGVALPGDPDDGTATVYAMQQIYPEDTATNSHLTSDSSTSNNTVRMVAASGAQQYVLRGGACTSIEFQGLNTGEVPSVRFTFTFAFWDDVSITFPSATSSESYAPAPCANGSFFYNDVGTVNRVTDSIRNFSLTIDHQMIPVIGQGGINSNQTIVGWVRGKSTPTISFDVESQAKNANPTWSAFFEEDPNSITNKHILYTCNPVDGRAVAFYFPNVHPTGPRPTMQDLEGLTYVNVQLIGSEGGTTTNAKTRSAWRMGLG